ncbi:MAG TPA: polysaccharide biosynthesis/export family protein [Stellaceae bacterium]|jgi:polysaccharide export outer membrane protein
MRGHDARGPCAAPESAGFLTRLNDWPRRPRAALASLTAAALFLSGCSTLPTSGPTTSDVMKQETVDNRTRFDIVDINGNVIQALHAAPHDGFRLRFKKYGKPPQPRIGVGDSIVVSIWEAAGGGLFSASSTDQVSAGSRSVTIPEQVVGQDGAITVPFAGRVRVAGRLPLEVQNQIQKRLADKAIEPQVIVTISKSQTNVVTVNGEVVGGARVPLSIKGDRLLDLIAEAGGAKAPIYETYVRLSRDGVTATIPMEALVSDPAENIYAQPGDVLTLVREPQTFTVFGATGTNAQIAFPSEHVTLIEAMAKAGGLQDMRSDPAGVFLMRFEPPPVLKALGRPVLATGPDGMTPVVYRLDMSDAKAYFFAQRFPIEDKDIIYVANADMNELQKFFTLLNTLTGPVITGIVVKNSTP